MWHNRLKKAFVPQWLWATLLILSSSVQSAEKPLKVAFMHENPVGQGGWTLSHELAREKIEDYFGDRIETSAVDGVVPGVDAERVLTKLARDDHDLIFATSFGFLNPTQKVAKRYRKVKFEHCSGYLTSANTGTYQIRAYQGRYLAGMLAGMVTKSDVVGYVGSFPIPEVVRGINAFTLGILEVNPDAKVELIWTNSWSDPAKEREATELLIAKGSDVVTHHTESPSVMKAASEAQVYSVGYQTDRAESAGEYHLVSVAHNWFPIYKYKIEQLLAGSWQPEEIWAGLEQNATQLVSPGKVVTEEMMATVEAQKQKIISGDLQVFTGPIRDQNGELQVAAGEVLDDKALLTMEWLAAGVSGKLDGH